MLYLSRLELNPLNRKVMRDVSDCQDLHRTILKGFPQTTSQANPRSSFNVLYRMEIGRNIIIYVQSTIEPDWSYLLQEHYLLFSEQGNPAVKRIDEHLARIREGMVLRFRLLANPTRKVKTNNKIERLAGIKNNGKRLPIHSFEDQIGWLKTKGESGGFKLLSIKAAPDVSNVVCNGSNVTIGFRPKKVSIPDRKFDRLTFKGVIFEGYLEVSDRNQFLGTITQGIGSGKAYGFGLLSVAGS